MITNQELAALFVELADIMELAGENFFKIKAYRQAAVAIGHSQFDIADQSPEKLLEMPGIGKAIAEKIGSAKASGTFPTLEKWRATGFASFRILISRSPILTVKSLRKLIKEYDLKSYDDLKNALSDGRLMNTGKLDSEFVAELRKQVQ